MKNMCCSLKCLLFAIVKLSRLTCAGTTEREFHSSGERSEKGAMRIGESPYHKRIKIKISYISGYVVFI